MTDYVRGGPHDGMALEDAYQALILENGALRAEREALLGVILTGDLVTTDAGTSLVQRQNETEEFYLRSHVSRVFTITIGLVEWMALRKKFPELHRLDSQAAAPPSGAGGRG